MNKLFTCLSHIGMAALYAIVVLFPKLAAAQVSMGRETINYTQNFDSLPAAQGGVWENGTSYIKDWFVQRTKQNNSLAVSHGNKITGSLYSYGPDKSDERALGAQSSLEAGEFAWGVLLQNNTGDTINELHVSFYGEQWRISEATAGEQKIAFYYAVSSDKDSFKLSPKSDENWTPYPELDFKGPHFETTGTKLDGNDPANRRLMSAVLAVSIPEGHYLMLRWKDANEPHTDHGLAIDDFGLTWTVEDGSTGLLPVELARFTAKSNGAVVALQWLTASEDQNDYFLIERSADGQAFESIGKADGKGTTVQETVYLYMDERPLAGTSYYRLKQVDEDGSHAYSSVVAVTRDGSSVASKVYPTITTDYLQIDLAQETNIKAAVVMDMMGRQLVQESFGTNTRQHIVDVRKLNVGTYVLVLLNEQGERQVTRFMKR